MSAAKFKAGDRIKDRNGTEYVVHSGRNGTAFIYVETVDITFGTNPNDRPASYTLVEQPAARVVDTELPPREGDTVLIRATYCGVGKYGHKVRFRNPYGHDHEFQVGDVAWAGVETRRGPKVGDQVRVVGTDERAKVVALFGEGAKQEAALAMDAGYRTWRPVNNLEPA